MQKLDHSQNIVEIKNVFFAYGAEDVLRDVTLNIHRGDYLGIVGPNGSGKTTLLKIILGLLNQRSGTIKLFSQKIGYVPQKAASFDAKFPATVEEVVMMGRYAKRGLFHSVLAEDRLATRRALETVGMWEFRNRLIGDLSGGQSQRVFIARALVNEPEIVFFDEPTAGIDTKSKKEFYDLLKKLSTETGLTLVLVSHDLDVLERETMHIACIDKTLVYFGSASAYEHHHEHQ